jgi:hypothetical protein
MLLQLELLPRVLFDNLPSLLLATFLLLLLNKHNSKLLKPLLLEVVNGRLLLRRSKNRTIGSGNSILKTREFWKESKR